MKIRSMKLFTVMFCFLFAACAVITVNIYFPEKAAKEAYKSLDDMLLKNSADHPASGQTSSAPEQHAPAPKPESRLFNRLPSFSLVSVASAAESEADTLAVEMASMPEVAAAYGEMNRRIPRLNALFGSGIIGLTSQGLVTVREKTRLAAGDEGLVAAENQSRKTIITGMAKAILKLNKQQETKAALDQVMAKAAATYAETRREAAGAGWWIQLQNGRWVQK